jgi:serine/threonine-protein kinase
MSPEQAYGRTNEVDAKSDVWAVGASMFYLLTGRHVHLGEGASEILIKAATSAAESMVSVRPETPPALVSVIDCALAFDKAKRWDSAAAMRDAVREAVKGLDPSLPRGKDALAPYVEDLGDAPTRAVAAFPLSGQPWTPSPGPHADPGASSMPATAVQPLPVPVRTAEPPTGTPITRTSPTMRVDRRVVQPALLGVLLAFVVVAIAGGVLIAKGNEWAPWLRTSAAVAPTTTFTTPAPHATSTSPVVPDLPPIAATAVPLPPPAPAPSASVASTPVPSAEPRPAASVPAPPVPGRPAAIAATSSPSPAQAPAKPAARPVGSRPAGTAKASDDDLFHP